MKTKSFYSIIALAILLSFIAAPTAVTPADACTAPAAPTGLMATDGNCHVSLAWNTNTESDLSGYNVYRSTSGGTYVNIGNTTVNAYTDISLIAGLIYCYLVTAFNNSNLESAYSLEVCATPYEPTPTPMPTPAPPTPTPPPSPPPGSQQVYTPAASPVTIDFGYIKVTFPIVSGPGNTWLGPANVDTSSGVAKSALSIVDIGSTASYEGPIEIAWGYDMSGLEKPESLKLYHFNGSQWENVTTSVDTANNMVYGQVMSLSPFLLGLGGCFIATAAYGSSLDNHVDTLRRFRDQYLETNPIGSAFVSLYYKLSPPMADFIEKHPAFKPIVRVALLPAVAMSSVALNTTLAEKIALLIAMALFTTVLIMWLMRKTRRLEMH